MAAPFIMSSSADSGVDTRSSRCWQGWYCTLVAQAQARQHPTAAGQTTLPYPSRPLALPRRSPHSPLLPPLSYSISSQQSHQAEYHIFPIISIVASFRLVCLLQPNIAHLCPPPPNSTQAATSHPELPSRLILLELYCITKAPAAAFAQATILTGVLNPI